MWLLNYKRERQWNTREVQRQKGLIQSRQALSWKTQHTAHLLTLLGLFLPCFPMNCSPPGSSVHGILQAKILEWVAIFFSRGSSWPRDQTYLSCVGRWILYYCITREALEEDRDISIFNDYRQGSCLSDYDIRFYHPYFWGTNSLFLACNHWTKE